MKVLIVANGKINSKAFYKKIIQDADKVIAADGGADNCLKLGIIPDYVIGDLDSISSKAQKKFRNIITHDPSQDATDLEKALALAKKLKCTKITITGAIGSRIDHTIANIISSMRANVPSEIVDETNNICIVGKKIEFSGKKGDIISVIPISKVKGLTYIGLKWNLKNKNVDTGWIGVSNKMIGNKAKISLKSGKIIVIRLHDR